MEMLSKKESPSGDPRADAWIACPRASSDSYVRLFCVPYAGGGAQVYHGWPQDLSPHIEVCSIHLPGRGRRFGEPAFSALRPLVHALAAGIRSSLDRPFAIFGHSMGGLIAFELARHLRRHHGVEPVHLFVSGAAAPHLPDIHRFHMLPDDQFIARVRELNGIAPDIAANAELMDLFVPVLRADFTVTGTYQYTEDARLGCPISVFGGVDDPLVSRDRLDPWCQHTAASCCIDMFPGDHFFLHTARQSLLRIVSTRLLAAPSATPNSPSAGRPYQHSE